jgi:hypothetical protein
MRDLQALADEGSAPLRRRRGLRLVYLVAAVFPGFNALVLLTLFPPVAGASSRLLWGLGTAFGLALLLIEGLKARSLGQKTPTRLIRAAFLDGLLLFVGLLLGVLAHKLALGWGWLFALLGLGSYLLGFVRVAAQLPQPPPKLSR